VAVIKALAHATPAENVVAPAKLAPLLEETRELIAIFVTSIKTARRS